MSPCCPDRVLGNRRGRALGALHRIHHKWSSESHHTDLHHFQSSCGSIRLHLLRHCHPRGRRLRVHILRLLHLGLWLRGATGCRGCLFQALRLYSLSGGSAFCVFRVWVLGAAEMATTKHVLNGPVLDRAMNSAEGAPLHDALALELVIAFMEDRVSVTEGSGHSQSFSKASRIIWRTSQSSICSIDRDMWTSVASSNFTMLIYPASSRDL